MNGSYKDDVCGTCWHREARGVCREAPPSMYNNHMSSESQGQPHVDEDRPACSRHLGVEVCVDCGARAPTGHLLTRHRYDKPVNVCRDCQTKWEVGR